MIQLIEQREGERALTVVSEREHHAYAFARARHAFDMRRIHHVIGHRLALRVVTRRIPLDQIRACQSNGDVVVGAAVHQAREFSRTKHRNRGLALTFAVAVGQNRRQRILMHQLRIKLVVVEYRTIIIEREERSLVSDHVDLIGHRDGVPIIVSARHLILQLHPAFGGQQRRHLIKQVRRLIGPRRRIVVDRLKLRKLQLLGTRRAHDLNREHHVIVRVTALNQRARRTHQRNRPTISRREIGRQRPLRREHETQRPGLRGLTVRTGIPIHREQCGQPALNRRRALAQTRRPGIAVRVHVVSRLAGVIPVGARSLVRLIHVQRQTRQHFPCLRLNRQRRTIVFECDQTGQIHRLLRRIQISVRRLLGNEEHARVHELRR